MSRRAPLASRAAIVTLRHKGSGRRAGGVSSLLIVGVRPDAGHLERPPSPAPARDTYPPFRQGDAACRASADRLVTQETTHGRHRSRRV
jgi:hypothetical protein